MMSAFSRNGFPHRDGRVTVIVVGGFLHPLVRFNWMRFIFGSLLDLEIGF